MLRILARIQVSGSNIRLAQLDQNRLIPHGVLRQIGLVRRIPDTDSSLYASPWYEFPLETFDSDIAEFLAVHEALGLELGKDLSEIRFAALTICPVDATALDQFAGFFDRDFLMRLSTMSLGLEIAPAQVMPQFARWRTILQ